MDSGLVRACMISDVIWKSQAFPYRYSSHAMIRVLIITTEGTIAMGRNEVGVVRMLDWRNLPKENFRNLSK
jgi:hypothetical protein